MKNDLNVKEYYPPAILEINKLEDENINIYNELISSYSDHDVIATIIKENDNFKTLNKRELEKSVKSLVFEINQLSSDENLFQKKYLALLELLKNP